jgi:hypothetical protein
MVFARPPYMMTVTPERSFNARGQSSIERRFETSDG